jgi:hypothetical protein
MGPAFLLTKPDHPLYYFGSMEKWRILFFFLFLSQCVTSCSQSAYGVKQIYAFKTMRMTGTAARDENGKTLAPRTDTSHFMYVEVKGEDVSWLGAWKEERSYHIKAFRENNLPLDLGKDKITGENIQISPPKKGCSIWQLALIPDTIKRTAPINMKQEEILLQGKKGNKIFTVKTSKEIELIQPPSQ